MLFEPCFSLSSVDLYVYLVLEVVWCFFFFFFFFWFISFRRSMASLVFVRIFATYRKELKMESFSLRIVVFLLDFLSLKQVRDAAEATLHAHVRYREWRLHCDRDLMNPVSHDTFLIFLFFSKGTLHPNLEWTGTDIILLRQFPRKEHSSPSSMIKERFSLATLIFQWMGGPTPV